MEGGCAKGEGGRSGGVGCYNFRFVSFILCSLGKFVNWIQLTKLTLKFANGQDIYNPEGREISWLADLCQTSISRGWNTRRGGGFKGQEANLSVL